MQNDMRVFSSEITRANKPLLNNLYDLINLVPAKPTTACRENENDCYFEPRYDKHYIPKKKSRMKVKTVRDIRNSFEKEVNNYLPSELEKQQNFLLRKIKAGSSRDENTKSIAKKILKCDNPLSRSAWQMLMNLNPEDHANSIQYVLWNGKCIRVNGSKGGRNKFVCNYDLANKKLQPAVKVPPGKKTTIKKKGLLKNSLTVKFKPGPLTRKTQLDDSYQKYNFGGIELAKLPKPGLEIQPTYGVALEPTVTTLLQSKRDDNGAISAKWAEFTVSVLGTVKDSDVIQSKGNNVTFDLNYNYDQKRLLMRRDVDNNVNENVKFNEADLCSTNDESGIAQEVSTIINKMLDSVEISLLQDDVYTGEEEPREIFKCKEIKTNFSSKDKGKKRRGELSRLDVTVIRLPEVSYEEKVDECHNEFCSLGCICASLQCPYNLKQHCGHIECMFECSCDFSKYKAADSFDRDCSELIPGLLNLDKEINSRLSKEEQKFHQTVVLTGDKSIVLKSERRNWKASKKYGDFFRNLCLKTELRTSKVLSVIDVKLNCENIEPWCMVHNLYKCFCKGKFIDNSLTASHEIHETETTVAETETTVAESDEPEVKSDNVQSESIVRSYANKRRINGEKISVDMISKSDSFSECIDTPDIDSVFSYTRSGCARVRAYSRRKFKDSYYLETHKKILEMERNDSKLHKKMISIVFKTDSVKEEQVCESRDTTNFQDQDFNNESNDSESFSKSSLQSNENNISQTYIDTEPSAEAIHDKPGTSILAPASNNDIPSLLYNDEAMKAAVPNKTKLIAWLESSYKLYKNRIDQGIHKTSLDPPKLGKVALYPWDFILSRYRERKNLFLISTQRPYRMFMAIDKKNDFFDNCINIDDIRFVDLHKYPITVRNLLTNATEMKDNFCILCGLAHCWELIGSVTKIKEQKDNGEEQDNFVDTDRNSLDSAPSIPDMDINVREIQQSMNENEGNSDSSKWFVMTVENDFSEIQFYQKGFFVKYESIIKAINVARMSGKTVRLSSQKCVEQNSPQFGIYAIPNTNEYSVFVGPYDKDDHLGIETVKTLSDIRKLKRTRGVWITTKKVDNIKVIDNPLSFMPPNNLHPSKIVSLENDFSDNVEAEGHSAEKVVNLHKNECPEEVSTKAKEEKRKLVKPIKIRKTNGFYHLAPKGFLNQVLMQPSQLETLTSPLPIATRGNKQKTSIIKPVLVVDQSVNRPSTSVLSNSDKNVVKLNPLMKLENNKPVAEIAPQIKIRGVYSETGTMLGDNIQRKKPERGMFVLKPEEINKRLMEKNATVQSDTDLPCTTATANTKECAKDEEINGDIENFLATTVARTSPDIYVISDEENCSNELVKDLDGWKNVWIECKNVDNLGLIHGRWSADNELSFQFPGFKYTEFYKTEDAFSKITQ